jgi:hypothetical protein
MKFMIGGKEVELNLHEMKHISNTYWEHWGKKSMLAYSERMIHKANENIKHALGMHYAPKDEDEVKDAIAEAFEVAMSEGDWDTLAEVLYESSERAAACFSYKSIKEDEE